MSEAIWIELIKIIPTFLWLGLGVAALIIAKRLLSQQAHRMTRVESPFVSVDFAQDAIDQAFNRGPETPGRDGAAGADEGRLSPDERLWRKEVGAWGTPPGGAARPEPADETTELRGRTAPEGQREEIDDFEFLGDAADPPAEREPASTATPPAYTAIPAQPGYRSAQPQAGTTAFRPPSYYAVTAQPERGLRAATRLADAADLLQGGAILWVDDHHQWNEPLIRLFRTAGIRVDLAGTTEETLRLLDRGLYDLVITDLRRERDPGDGVAGMALLDRMIARGIPTPAVVFSDNPQVRTMSHPRAAATTNSPEELVNRVVDLVAHRRNGIDQTPGRGMFFGNG